MRLGGPAHGIVTKTVLLVGRGLGVVGGRGMLGLTSELKSNH